MADNSVLDPFKGLGQADKVKNCVMESTDECKDMAKSKQLLKCPMYCRSNCANKHHPLLVALLNCKYSEDPVEMNWRLTELHIVIQRYIKQGRWGKDDSIPDSYPTYKYPMLHWAATLGNIEAVKFLLDFGMDPKIVAHGFGGETILQKALICLQETTPIDCFEKFELLVELLDNTIPITNHSGNTVLHTCCEHLVNEIPKLEYFQHCLLCIVDHYRYEMRIRELCDLLEQQNMEGNTCLHILCRKDKCLMQIRSLLRDTSSEQNSLVIIKNNQGQKLVDVAVENGATNLAQHLQNVMDRQEEEMQASRNWWRVGKYGAKPKAEKDSDTCETGNKTGDIVTDGGSASVGLTPRLETDSGKCETGKTGQQPGEVAKSTKNLAQHLENVINKAEEEMAATRNWWMGKYGSKPKAERDSDKRETSNKTADMVNNWSVAGKHRPKPKAERDCGKSETGNKTADLVNNWSMAGKYGAKPKAERDSDKSETGNKTADLVNNWSLAAKYGAKSKAERDRETGDKTADMPTSNIVYDRKGNIIGEKLFIRPNPQLYSGSTHKVIPVKVPVQSGEPPMKIMKVATEFQDSRKGEIILMVPESMARDESPKSEGLKIKQEALEMETAVELSAEFKTSPCETPVLPDPASLSHVKEEPETQPTTSLMLPQTAGPGSMQKRPFFFMTDKVALVKEVLDQCPFGVEDPAAVWAAIARNLTKASAYEYNARTAKEHFDLLLQYHRTNNHEKLKKCTTEEEYGRMTQMLTELDDLERTGSQPKSKKKHRRQTVEVEKVAEDTAPSGLWLPSSMPESHESDTESTNKIHGRDQSEIKDEANTSEVLLKPEKLLMKTNQLFVYMRGHPDWVDKEAIPKSYDQISSDNRTSLEEFVSGLSKLEREELADVLGTDLDSLLKKLTVMTSTEEDLSSKYEELQDQQMKLVLEVQKLLHKLTRLKKEEHAFMDSIQGIQAELNTTRTTHRGLKERLHHCNAALKVLEEIQAQADTEETDQTEGDGPGRETSQGSS